MYTTPDQVAGFLNGVDELLEAAGDIQFTKQKKKAAYAEVAAVVDIESTSFYEGAEKRATMYAWTFGLAGQSIRGRTWPELIDTLSYIGYRLELGLRRRLVVYIHNLSYEFQWMRKWFVWDKIFATAAREPLYAVTEDGIEFRCSYMLSARSLAAVGENLTKYHVKKAVGDLDYDLLRHSNTPLTETEWGYILNDGLVVMAYIQEQLDFYGTITKIPLTNTGVVRQHFVQNTLKSGTGREYYRLIRSLTMTVDDYIQLKKTFAGGFTHANVRYVGKLLHNIGSADKTSAYPAAMVSEKFPMSKAYRVEITSLDQFKYHLESHCCMFTAVFENLRSISNTENYLSYSRCEVSGAKIINNGRIVEADELTAHITEIDWEIILQTYEFDKVSIGNFAFFYKDYLPREVVLTVLELYQKKTELKGVEEAIDEYMRFKGMQNSCFGMAVTDPCKDEQVYSNNQWQSPIKVELENAVADYNNNKNRTLFYPWGVWITAYTRRNLFRAILEFGDDYVYSDTDSVKGLNFDDHAEFFEQYNAEIMEKVAICLKHHNIPLSMATPKTIRGETKPIGVWDDEGRYSDFKTLGAKRYMSVKKGKLEITIAGVGKKIGTEYLRNTYKTNDKILAAFDDDLYFPPNYEHNGKKLSGCGKLLHTYIDYEFEGDMIDYLGNAGHYKERSAIHLQDEDYSLALDTSFVKLIEGIQEGHILQ